MQIQDQLLACAGPGCRRERSFKLYQNECDSVNEARRKCKKARFVLFFLLKLTSLAFKNSWEVNLKQVCVYCENI